MCFPSDVVSMLVMYAICLMAIAKYIYTSSSLLHLCYISLFITAPKPSLMGYGDLAVERRNGGQRDHDSSQPAAVLKLGQFRSACASRKRH